MNDTVDTAVTAVASSDVAGTAAATDMSMLGLFLHADWVVKLIIIGLLLASFWCWAIIFDKYLTFKNAKARAERFEKEFWQADELDGFYDRTKKKKGGHPFANVFLAAMDEWYRSQQQQNAGANNKAPMAQRMGMRERMFQVMMVTRNREMDRIAKGIGVLASVGSSAPFIGLFGTVWGIMNSFQSIALSKNTSLAIVAPGIAEALFATAIGLFAAIPAVIAYNKFAGDLDKFDGRLEDFSVEFNTLLSRQLEN
jgi:biopolymer transport protein TolQ